MIYVHWSSTALLKTVTKLPMVIFLALQRLNHPTVTHGTFVSQYQHHCFLVPASQWARTVWCSNTHSTLPQTTTALSWVTLTRPSMN